MGAAHPKQYLDIHGRPMIWHAIRAFEKHAAISRIYVVISAQDGWWDGYDWSVFHKLAVLRCGGSTRADSVLNGLRACASDVAAEDWMLVHDAARPCLSQELLDKLLAELDIDPVGGILAAPVADTLKRQTGEGRIAETVPRAGLWGAQTPQMFRHAMLTRALAQVGGEVTDEASAIEAMGLAPKLVESDLTNLKVTYPRDLDVAAWLLGQRSR
ncbi:MAG: 2-C-methyl-D-erythritol 4-phosphate cytidylyltransferase [Hydrogenophilales bacterium 28-61-23]|nr:MAG: 2-C-methyl-D-erythritol 4-phosphate cytidylyltransferase [Hydrogenophilales bacterium 28-61-23]